MALSIRELAEVSAPIAASLLLKIHSKILFLLGSSLLLIVAGLCILLIKETIRKNKPIPSSLSDHHEKKSKIQVYTAILLFTFLSLISFNVMRFVPIYLSEVKGIAIEHIGAFFSIIASMSAVSFFLSGYVLEKVKDKKTLVIIGTVLRSIFFVLLPISSLYTLYIIPLVTLPFSLSFVSTTKRLYEETPLRQRGKVFSTGLATRGIATIIGPLLYGTLWHTSAPDFIFVVAALIMSAATAPLYYVLRARAAPH